MCTVQANCAMIGQYLEQNAVYVGGNLAHGVHLEPHHL